MNIHHICIQTNNYKESLAFYIDILNFELIEETKNFNNREYNTWLKLDGFMIELQTSKNSNRLKPFKNETEGIVHFCLFSSNFNEVYSSINCNKKINFKLKNGNKIYRVGTNKLFKLIAPEGSIIEIRDTEYI